MTLYDLESVPKNRTAVLGDDGKQLFYGDIYLLTNKFMQIIEPRRICLIFTQNSVDCLAGVVSLMNCGVVPLLVDLNTDESFIQNLVSTYLPEYLYAPTNNAKQFPDYVCIDTQGEYQLCLNKQPLPGVVHPDLALLLSTSGSTGSPRLVRQSYSNLKSNGHSIIEYLGIGPTDRAITSLPMHYTYGFSVLNSHLMAGATLLITNRSVMEKQFWDFFRDKAATSIAGVPYTYTILKRLGMNKMKLPTLTTLTQAGGKLAKPIIEEFAKYADENGIKFFVMYGQTEATARMSYVPAESALKKAGSIGIPIPNGEFFLVDNDERVIQSSNQEGQLGYRGPNVSMGYADSRIDLSKGDERDGVLLTGDIAYRDEDGYYFITGRMSRFVKVFGKRVSLDDIEQILQSYAGDVACSGVDDEILIWITDETKQETVRKQVSSITGIHPSAFTVQVVKSLPRTSSGKIDYKYLLKETTDD
jgi:acyl-coenzyme A synthetase/AMP-(fatty) acid ligase